MRRRVVGQVFKESNSKDSGPRCSPASGVKVKRKGVGEKRTKNRSRRSGVLGLVSRLNYKKRLPTPLLSPRDGVENLPAWLSGIFAAESDQGRIFELLSAEIQQCLEGLANGTPDQKRDK